MQLEISVDGTFRMKLYCKAEAGYFVLYFKQILKKLVNYVSYLNL